MGTVVVVEAIPFSDLLSEIDIALVGEQLAEPLLGGPVRSLHLAVELRCSRFDADLPDPLVGYVPVEFCLELLSPIGSDRVSLERKLLGNVADEVDGVGLCVAAVDLQRANSRIIIDGRVRVPPHRRPFLLPQSWEFHVYLYGVWPGTLALNWSTQQPIDTFAGHRKSSVLRGRWFNRVATRFRSACVKAYTAATHRSVSYYASGP